MSAGDCLNQGFTGLIFTNLPGYKLCFSNFSVPKFNFACVPRLGSGSGVTGQPQSQQGLMSKLAGQFHNLLTTGPQYLCLPLKAFVCFERMCLWFPRDCSWRCICKEGRIWHREKLDCREVAAKIPCGPWGALELE